ncbi:hypothetical protein TRICHSKD4_4515 [Roseibium sp. TrichSKD4]|uniref:hypothetical protein n=1 Tax=Roseibium sp. TrichSKD4 TaxID=744980 RepID=UPI0001E575A8|nr:hypothetical protein [Roseibium sp. TrichSKD4]EFO30915.1 hypothetical protein TRICHSKD4_4515 [Roseibium sp. TrichSKD4]
MAEQKARLIQPGISVGNVVTILIMLCSLALGWGRMESALGDHERRILAGETERKEMRKAQSDFSTGFAELRADMRHVLTEVSRMRQTVERIECERRQ